MSRDEADQEKIRVKILDGTLGITVTILDRLHQEREERRRVMEESLHEHEDVMNQTRRDNEMKIASLEFKVKTLEQVKFKLEEDIERQKAEFANEKLMSSKKLHDLEITLRDEGVSTIHKFLMSLEKECIIDRRTI